MELSKRLRALVELMEPGQVVADIGCDHGYVSIYLAKEKQYKKIIAMDVATGPLERARANIEKYQVGDRIETRLSNGLNRLEVGEADSIICAGMGGELMMQILLQDLEKAKALKQMILQPQSELQRFREFLWSMDFCITKEDMLKEDGKYYPMMRVVPLEPCEKRDKPSRVEMAYGPELLKMQHPVLKEYLYKERMVTEGIYQHLQMETTAGSERQEKRRRELAEKLADIQEALSYFAAP